MEREKLESELRHAQQQLEHVVTSNPSILFALSVNRDQIEGVSWIDENVKHVLGYEPSEALGRDWWEAHIHPDDRCAVLREIQARLFAAGQTTNEFRFKHADGQYHWNQCRIRLIRDESHRSIEAVGVWVDITDCKRAEAEQAKLREELQHAQKLGSVARLAGGAAHDFNNLLTVMNGYSDLLLKRLPAEDPLRECAAEIRAAGEHAAFLTQQLLILSRKQVVQPIKTNLNGIILETGKILERVIGEDIPINYVLDPELGHVLADPGQLRQILINLAMNARDAMPGGGALLVETANVELGDAHADRPLDIHPGPYVCLKVSDTGVGMDSEVLSHLFEPFFTTKRLGEGTGLGLATVYGIVKQAGGSISVHSEAGHGSAFTTYLPRVEQDTAPIPEAAPAVPRPTGRGRETILAVDDHEQVRGIAVHVLCECGYKVLEAASPDEALALSQGHAGPIHLLLTDIIMPGMTGPELADRIRASRPLTKVVFMSAYSELAITQRGVLPSSINFLQKPFSPEELAGKVREAFGPP